MTGARLEVIDGWEHGDTWVLGKYGGEFVMASSGVDGVRCMPIGIQTILARRLEIVLSARDAWKAMAEAEARLLIAYRVGSQQRGGAAADAVGRARDQLRELGEDVGKI